MAKLVYIVNLSLDGYISDATGSLDWTTPSDEMLEFINDLVRPVGTYLYGRRMYEAMVYWETAHTLVDAPAVEKDFTHIWQGADKIVFSTTLDAPSSARTEIERQLDPALVRQLKQSSEQDLTVGGPDLAAQMLQAGLVDELQLFVAPILLGGGTRAFPDGLLQSLELMGEHRFESGTTYLNYRVME